MTTDEFRRLRAQGKLPAVTHSDRETGEHKRGTAASQAGPRRSTDHFLIGVKAAAVWLGIPIFTVYNWAQTGKIPHFKLEKRVMFSKEELKSWVESHRRFRKVEGS